jgi:hypothetical protein
LSTGDYGYRFGPYLVERETLEPTRRLRENIRRSGRIVEKLRIKALN